MKILRIGSTQGETFTLLKNIEDVRRYVDNYFGQISTSSGLGDLSNLSIEAHSVLLKFIEEKIEDITCFASRDNINPVLMSRFDKVEKFDTVKIGTDSFVSFSQYVEERELKDVSMEREFAGKSAQYLDSYLIFRKLNRSVRSRIGHLL